MIKKQSQANKKKYCHEKNVKKVKSCCIKK